MEKHDEGLRPDVDATPPAAEGASGFLYGDITRTTIGSMFEVHDFFGYGFTESIYANALAVELRARGLYVEREVVYEVFYRGILVGRYVADLIVESKVVVEVKVARSIEPPHRAQLLNYLRASGLQVGLVLNFWTSAQFKRVVSTEQRSDISTVRVVTSNGNG